MLPCARLALTAGFALSATSALAEAVALPTGFDGVYAPDGVTCDGLVITVDGGTMVGGDGAMSVTDLIEDPANPNRVEASLLVSGGGGEWTDSAVITLSEDGRALQFDYADGASNTWTRCP